MYSSTKTTAVTNVCCEDREIRNSVYSFKNREEEGGKHERKFRKRREIKIRKLNRIHEDWVLRRLSSNSDCKLTFNPTKKTSKSHLIQVYAIILRHFIIWFQTMKTINQMKYQQAYTKNAVMIGSNNRDRLRWLNSVLLRYCPINEDGWSVGKSPWTLSRRKKTISVSQVFRSIKCFSMVIALFLLPSTGFGYS